MLLSHHYQRTCIITEFSANARGETFQMRFFCYCCLFGVCELEMDFRRRNHLFCLLTGELLVFFLPLFPFLFSSLHCRICWRFLCFGDTFQAFCRRLHCPSKKKKTSKITEASDQRNPFLITTEFVQLIFNRKQSSLTLAQLVSSLPRFFLLSFCVVFVCVFFFRGMKMVSKSGKYHMRSLVKNEIHHQTTAIRSTHIFIYVLRNSVDGDGGGFFLFFCCCSVLFHSGVLFSSYYNISCAHTLNKKGAISFIRTIHTLET